jgi:hypothetical protein
MNIKRGNGFSKGFRSVLHSLVRLAAAFLTLGVSVSATAAPVDPATSADALARLESRISAMLADFRATDKASLLSAAPDEKSADKPAAVTIPVPAALWLFGSGLGALGYAGRYARRRMTTASRRRSQDSLGADPGEASGASGKISGSAPRRHTYMQVTLRERMLHAGAAASCDRFMPGRMDRSGPPAGGHGDDGASPKTAAIGCEAMQRFTELAAALTEQPGVILGRSFGRPCLKLGKRPFLAYDENDQGLAFRVGQLNAGQFLDQAPGISLWNPKRERQPKQSWVLCQHGSGETLVHLAAAAYEHALGDSLVVESATECQRSLLAAA